MRIESLGYLATPEDCFSYFRDLPYPVLLCSALHDLALASQNPDARYDIFSAAPRFYVSNDAGQAQIQCQLPNLTTPANAVQYKRLDYPGSAEQFIGEQLQSLRVSDQSLPFVGGALGYLSYDYGLPSLGLTSRHPNAMGLAELGIGLYGWAVITDHHLKQTHWVLSDWLSEDLEQLLRQRFSAYQQQPHPQHGTFRLHQAFAAHISLDEYLQAFKRSQDYIEAGDCYQVNLAQCFSAAFDGDPFAAFLRLRAQCPTPFAGYLEVAGKAILCCSPERFLAFDADQVISQPIKGTRPRYPDAQQDLEAQQALLSSPKDRAENLMIVDLLRNDLGRFCQTGSVQVPKLFALESYHNVHHLVSTISGRLQPQIQPFQAWCQAFPGGSITGAPKRRAMEIIDELEAQQRSIYCGSLGYFSCNGRADSNIAIRTLVCSEQRIYCWGGGGLVVDSDPHQEYQESLAKVQALMQALENL